MKTGTLLNKFPDRSSSGLFSTYAQPIDDLKVEGMGDFPALLLAIWQLREDDLQKRYPLNSIAGRLGFLAWCITSGLKEYQALRELKSFWEGLAKPAALPFTYWSDGISIFLRLAIVNRNDLGIDSRLSNSDSQAAALYWFWCAGGYKDFDTSLLHIPRWQAQFLINHTDLVKTRFADLLYKNRPDLQELFDLDTDHGKESMRNWMINQGKEETGLNLLIQALNPEQLSTAENPIKRSKNYPFGVNLIGYAFGELGIGEDIRMAAHACYAAGIPFCVIDFTPGNNIRQNDRSIESWVVNQPIYSINIFCLTALENLRFFVEKGSHLFKDRYNIGYWPWELEFWPENWKHCFNLIDEAWASSQHIAKAMRYVSPVPVHWMPMAVNLTKKNINNKLLERNRFGLPIESTLFVYSFDGNSFIQRKNPLGVLEAFLKAFPKNEEKVGLVIKCMRPDPINPIWQRILSVAKNDQRIFIIDEILDKLEVLNLYQACDAFVSLHRAEGFGRGIAEALLLNLDVIATDYSGNIDFCRPTGAYMVPYCLRELSSEEYIEADNNFWAEPDLDAAAEAMRCVAKEQRRTNLILSRLLFSPLTVGERYKQRLSKFKPINK